MSGLQSYYSATSNYGSNQATSKAFLDNYDSNLYNTYEKKLADKIEKGKGLMELGGAIEGSYGGYRAIKGSIQRWKSKYGKNDGNEDGDQELDGDDTTPDIDTGDVDADTSADTSADMSADVADASADASNPFTFSSFMTTQKPPDVDTGNFDDINWFDTQLSKTGVRKPISGADDADDTSADMPDDTSADMADTSADMADDAQDIGQDLGIDVDTVGDMADTALSGLAETGAEVGAEVGGGLTSDALLAGLGVGAEAVPIVGGLALLGIGAYDIFHHNSKPKAPPPPTNTVSQKGEMVVPSFDSVVDVPASQSAF